MSASTKRSLPCWSAGAIAVALVTLASPAWAAANLITNGDFTNYTVNGAASTTSYIVTGGTTSGTTGATLTGWTNTGYSFVFQPNAASSTGAVVNATTNLYLWGPDGTTTSTYSNNGFVSSPTGGAYLAMDGAYQTGYIGQTINNLTVGQAYSLSFNWAAAQQSGYSGATTDSWTVYWADASNNVITKVSTPTITNPDHGFTGWINQTYTFVATTTSMSVAFMAAGAPGGTPPFSLLDSVTLSAVPEPAGWVVLASGLAALGFVRLRTNRRRIA